MKVGLLRYRVVTAPIASVDVALWNLGLEANPTSNYFVL